jgi:hypothetical protein
MIILLYHNRNFEFKLSRSNLSLISNPFHIEKEFEGNPILLIYIYILNK